MASNRGLLLAFTLSMIFDVLVVTSCIKAEVEPELFLRRRIVNSEDEDDMFGVEFESSQQSGSAGYQVEYSVIGGPPAKDQRVDYFPIPLTCKRCSGGPAILMLCCERGNICCKDIFEFCVDCDPAVDEFAKFCCARNNTCCGSVEQDNIVLPKNSDELFSD